MAKLTLAAGAVAAVLLVAVLLTALLLRRPAIKSVPSPSSPPPPPPPPPPPLRTEDNAVAFDFSPYLILFRNGTVERLSGTDRVPASNDTAAGVASRDVVINATTGVGAASRDVVINATTGVGARIYAPIAALNNGTARLPVIVYYHGGAFVIESPFSPKYHNYLNALAAAANTIAVSVGYRLAPEHALPAAYDDSWQALNWVIKNCIAGDDPWLRDHSNLSRLFLVGDSVGANIAHNMAIRAGDEKTFADARIEGLVLTDPYFWGKEPVANETRDPAVRRSMEVTWGFVCGNKYGIDSPFVNPLAMAAEDWRRLACERVAVTVAGEDTLRARGLAYAAALRGSKWWRGEVQVYETAGEGHTYYLSQPAGEKAAEEMSFVAGFLNGGP